MRPAASPVPRTSRTFTMLKHLFRRLMPELYRRLTESGSPAPAAGGAGSYDFLMGDVLYAPVPSPFLLSEEHLATHACVLGQTGSGKSKFLELLMRHLAVHG